MHFVEREGVPVDDETAQGFFFAHHQEMRPVYFQSLRAIEVFSFRSVIVRDVRVNLGVRDDAVNKL